MEPENNKLLRCRECHVTVHASCYGVIILPTDVRNWACDKCKAGRNDVVLTIDQLFSLFTIADILFLYLTLRSFSFQISDVLSLSDVWRSHETYQRQSMGSYPVHTHGAGCHFQGCHMQGSHQRPDDHGGFVKEEVLLLRPTERRVPDVQSVQQRVPSVLRSRSGCHVYHTSLQLAGAAGIVSSLPCLDY